MPISAFDIFKIGIGPSSSHTVGPMKAAERFSRDLLESGLIKGICGVKIELFGSLALTGKGHCTDRAIMLGLEGKQPKTVDPTLLQSRPADIETSHRLLLASSREIVFDPKADIIFKHDERLPFHSNGMRFTAVNPEGNPLRHECFYSIGGGFVVNERGEPIEKSGSKEAIPYPFRTAGELLDCCNRSGLSIACLMLKNEAALQPEERVREGLFEIWRTMRSCIEAGLSHEEGLLPGGLQVRRRAPALYRKTKEQHKDALEFGPLDLLSAFAIAVNEENAALGRVVTAPTNGAAGIIPSVLCYYREHLPSGSDEGIADFILTAAAMGILYKEGASLSAAEMGCQGEVGVACSMAAAGLAAVLGGSINQIENAAEIAMEHSLGLTCDPVGGLVQIPCIERNAIGAVKAVNAARLALQSDGRHIVSLDRVIAAMKKTGEDMLSKYKETSLGGLAVAVTQPEC